MTSTLAAAVAAWCDTRRVRLMRIPAASETADGWWTGGRHVLEPPPQVTGQWATVPPLLTQLAAAVAPSGESGKGTGRGSGGPVDWDAVDILDRLRDVAGWRPETARAGLGRALRMLPVLPWDAGAADQTARVLRSLAGRADALLAPAEVAGWRYIRDDCPACGYRVVSVPGDAGDPVRGFALVVEFTRQWINSMSCQVCWGYWTRQDLADWAAARTAELVPA